MVVELKRQTPSFLLTRVICQPKWMLKGKQIKEKHSTSTTSGMDDEYLIKLGCSVELDLLLGSWETEDHSFGLNNQYGLAPTEASRGRPVLVT